MNNAQTLINALGLDAVKYMDLAFVSFAPDVQTRVMAGIQAGGAFEVRVRMATGKQPRMSLVVISDKGELELHTMGGGPAT